MKYKATILLTTVSALVLTHSAFAQETTTLDTVVITASRSEETKREVTSNVTVISHKEIETSTAQNIADLMQQKGFPVINQGTQKTVQIRGMGQRSMATEMSSDILVLLNGRRIGANNVALMGLANIDRVEIIRGPSAVQYGPSAMGGVINIITKRGTEEIEVNAEAGIGSFGYNKQSFGISGAKNGFDFSGSVTRQHRDNYKIRGSKIWRNTSYDSSISSNLDLGYTFLERHRLGLNFNYYGQNNARSPADGWSGTGAISNNLDYNQMDLSNYNMAFLYDGGTADNLFSWNLRYSFGRDRSEADYYNSAYGDSWGDNVLDNQSAAGQITYDNKIWALTFGFDYVNYDYDQEGSYTNDKSHSRDLGGYVSGKVRLFDERLILTAAGRYDRYKVSADSMAENNEESNFSPSVGFAYVPFEWLKIRGHYAEGFRMPDPGEITGGYQTLANYDLKPEKSKTFEGGVDLSWSFVNLGLTYFHTDWKDKIMASSVGFNRFQNDNLDGAVLAGLELSLQADIGKALGQEYKLAPFINLNHLTSRKNKDEETVLAAKSDIIPNVPETTVSFGIAFEHPEYGLKANVQASYYSDTLSRDWRLNSPTYYDYVTTKNTTVVDASLEKVLFKDEKKGTLSARAEANNIFDNRNEYYLDYPNTGRNFNVSLKYNLKF